MNILPSKTEDLTMTTAGQQQQAHRIDLIGTDKGVTVKRSSRARSRPMQ